MQSQHNDPSPVICLKQRSLQHLRLSGNEFAHCLQKGLIKRKLVPLQGGVIEAPSSHRLHSPDLPQGHFPRRTQAPFFSPLWLFRKLTERIDLHRGCGDWRQTVIMDFPSAHGWWKGVQGYRTHFSELLQGYMDTDHTFNRITPPYVFILVAAAALHTLTEPDC